MASTNWSALTPATAIRFMVIQCQRHISNKISKHIHMLLLSFIIMFYIECYMIKDIVLSFTPIVSNGLKVDTIE